MSKLNLPINVIKSLRGTHGQLRFRWKMTTHAIPGKDTLDCVGSLPPSAEGAVAELIAMVKRQAKEIAALKARCGELGTEVEELVNIQPKPDKKNSRRR